ncbi:MAG: hypothetical protein LBK13_10975 [Spirochaetales bacterium]|jgi:hypothetical protein|nr:hypothetical protein [Spirochaetales bacterium]
MKKNNFFVQTALLAVVSLILAGCVTDEGIYDPSVSPEQLCTLQIGETISVYQFDGNAVDWYSRLFTFSAVVQIPAGYHEFIMNYGEISRSYSRRANDIHYSYTFEAGKSYVMSTIINSGRVFIQVDIKEE